MLIMHLMLIIPLQFIYRSINKLKADLIIASAGSGIFKTISNIFT